MKKNSIRSKILIAILGITLFTAITIAMIFYHKSEQMIEENYVDTLQQQVRFMTDTIDDMMLHISDIAIKASCDVEIREQMERYLRDENVERLEFLASKLRLYGQRAAKLSSIYLILPEKNQIITTLDYPVYRMNLDNGRIQELIVNVQQSSNPVVVEDLLHDDMKLLSFVEKITGEDGAVLGYVCANITEAKLSYLYFADITNEDLRQIYLIKDQQIIATKQLSMMGTYFPVKNAKKWREKHEVIHKNQQDIDVYCRGAFSKCGIFVSVKRNEILSNLNKIKKYILAITTIVLLVAFFVSLHITKIVYRPIKKLSTAMKKVSAGELETRVEVVSKDEIGIVAYEFNRMLNQIEELIKQLIVEEHKKKDAELEALQYQITPHFMYNTLNSIKCYAYIHQQKEIAEVIDDFVELLQACIRKKGAFLTVAEEVQMLGNYVRLQEFRNGERYQTSYVVEKDAQQCLIPRLILQPLVENAILHGLDLKNQKNQLQIHAWIEGDQLYLEVKDNGRGMTKEKIAELLSRKEKKTRGLTAVGIPNIRERLHLYYGAAAGLSYASGEEGTTAIIHLPVTKSEE